MPSLESVLSDESDHWRVKCERLEAINAEMLTALKNMIAIAEPHIIQAQRIAHLDPKVTEQFDKVLLAILAIAHAEGRK